MQDLVLSTALTFIAFLMLTFVYMSCTAMLARWFGIGVDRVTIGSDFFNLYLFSWQGRYWEWRIGILPIMGYVAFKNSDNEPLATDEGPHEDLFLPDPLESSPPADCYQAAGRLAKMGLALVGPLSQIVLATLLLTVAVLQQTEQLQYAPQEGNPLQPSAVPGLQISDQVSTWEGQETLLIEVASQAFPRFLLFQPLDGWGGFCGWLITGGTIGSQSISMWLTFLGLAAMLNGVFNLLPLCGLNGFQIIRLLSETVLAKDFVEKWLTRYLYVTFFFVIAVGVRILYADVVWLLR